MVRRACGAHGLAIAVWTSARRVVGRVGLAWRGILETESNRGTAAANHEREQMCSGGRVWAGQLSAVSRRRRRLVTDSRTSRQSMAQHGSTRSQKPSRARHVNMSVHGRECAAGCRQDRTKQHSMTCTLRCTRAQLYVLPADSMLRRQVRSASRPLEWLWLQLREDAGAGGGSPGPGPGLNPLSSHSTLLCNACPPNGRDVSEMPLCHPAASRARASAQCPPTRRTIP